MAQDCSLQMPEDFVLPLLPAEELKDKYRRYLFRDYVEVCVLNFFALMLYQVLHVGQMTCQMNVERKKDEFM